MNLCFFYEMRWRTPILSASSVRSLLREVAATKSLPQIAQLHQHLTAAGLTGDPFLSTKLLELYADAGDLPSALSLFAVLPSPSVFAWTPILALLSRSGHHPPAASPPTAPCASPPSPPTVTSSPPSSAPPPATTTPPPPPPSTPTPSSSPRPPPSPSPTPSSMPTPSRAI
ncbi:unnamed protein product [Musa acuminata subsp. malaccensis]|uniref:(wild Malaysian banana) hypothetical protein n=1 Tax=Musa acuminata subsp. malaccensis TaxID=214687 RepID=A0A8D7BBV7_MUSAM|nr:unnamed protein product [Musa acuminata subsp. malaccensis]